jgi:hypothetical protein
MAGFSRISRAYAERMWKKQCGIDKWLICLRIYFTHATLGTLTRDCSVIIFRANSKKGENFGGAE